MAHTTLIIARHGNTFLSTDTPTRVGARTDLDLVPSGVLQAEQLGTYLKDNNLIPHHVIAGPLKRTKQMAEHAVPDMPYDIDARLREVDYGIDENQTEDTVVARIGAKAIKMWDEHAIVPNGWQVNPEQMKQDWHDIAQETINTRKGHTTLIVTSNGVARFAPYITDDFEAFKTRFSLKLATGALGILVYDEASWHARDWNIRPENHLNQT